MKKKLIEVALPLEAINAACKADKDRKTGTIRNLHKWFAPMPTPAWRALIFASLVDDPGTSEARRPLFSIIERLVASGAEPPAASVIQDALDALPPGMADVGVLDPFCGGGSTLVEAQRFGLPCYGSDLNPVPVLISRMLTSYPQRFANRPPVGGGAGSRSSWTGTEGLVADLRHYAKRIRDEAFSRLGPLYPATDDGSTPYAWIWARSATCTNPACNATIPMITSTWLSKRKGDEAWVVASASPSHLTIDVGGPSGTAPDATKVGRGGRFRCLNCQQVIEEQDVRSQGERGQIGTVLLATASAGSAGRGFEAPTERQRSAADVGPTETVGDIDLVGKAATSTPLYGLHSQLSLYTNRQQVMLGTFAELVGGVVDWVVEDGGSKELGAAVASFMSLSLSKLAMSSSTLVRWRIDSRNGAPKAEPAFGRHDLPMSWDFAETNPFGESVGDWLQVVETSLRAFELIAKDAAPSQVEQLDARAVASTFPPNLLIATDPPYFDNIEYADLSDYFYLWIRAGMKGVDPELVSTLATPKAQELIASPSRHDGSRSKARDYFVDGFTQVFEGLSQLRHPDLPIVVIYAFRGQSVERGGRVSTGWEAMLTALHDAGLGLVGSWPIHGAGSARMVGQGANALATYVVMVCRPLAEGAPVTTLREFRQTLASELAGPVRELQGAAIAPVDLAQAAIGPGMSIFARYSRVLEADGSVLDVGTVLSLINEVLDELVAKQDADFDGDTRWAIAWYENYGLNEADFGVADALATAKNLSVSWLVDAGIVTSQKGRVRLLGRHEIPADWDPRTDRRLTVWEVCQHLTRLLETEGEVAAADLLQKVGGLGEGARELAYRLFSIAERKGWAKEAQALNGLVVSWPELLHLIESSRSALPEQESML